MLKIKKWKSIGIVAVIFSLTFFADSSAVQASAMTSANVITLINQSRAAEGLSTLATNAKLNLAAQNKANDMFAQQYFEHIGPDGRGPSDWIEEAGYDWNAYGENIAWGYDTAEEVHTTFMNSPGHRENIMGDFEHVGVGAVLGTFEGQTTYMVVEEFGSSYGTEPTEPPVSTAYTLTLKNGVGGGTYAAGTVVDIIGNLPTEGIVFDGWTGDTQYAASAGSYLTYVIMPAKNISLTANFKYATPATYALTVTNGIGDGSYNSGTKVKIVAGSPAAGKIFDKWTGSTSYLASVLSATTTVTMPSSAITVVATYKNIPAYALTINNGNGDGSYASGTKVSISANSPASGKVFDKWTGDTSCIAGISFATTTVTMPAKGITLTATYKDLPVSAYSLTVTNGSGDGTYSAGTAVTIIANAPATGKVFDKWTGDTSYITTATSSTATVTMPAKAITLAATYKTATAITYALTVNNGSGDGSYTSGTDVTITASSSATGKVFDKWTGDTAYLSSIYSATATVTMPAKAVTLTAIYKTATAVTYSLVVASGTGDGSYTSGTKVTVTADSSASGKVFDKWTGDTAYLSSIYTTVATVTIPAKSITLTATYKTAATSAFTLTINRGDGGGSYLSGTDIIIIANVPPAGKTFDKWTGDTTYVSNPSSLISAVTMPAKNTTLTATYKTSIVTTYSLTVANGTGDGSYANSTEVTITADTPADGVVFDKWMGDIDYIVNTTSAIITLTMPAKAIILTATYKDAVVISVDGLLVRIEDSPKIYVIIGGEKKWISTPEVFEQLGYQWTNIEVVTETELDKYPDYEDNLIRAIGDYKIYLVVSGIKRHIPNPEIFLDYGFDWGDVKDVDQAVLDKYKDAYLIRASKGTDVFNLIDGVRKLIPSADIFNSYNNKWADIQVISQTEMNAYPLSSLIKLSGSVDVYLIEGAFKRKIPSVAVFDKYKFSWNYVVTVNQTEFNYYKIGAEVE